MATFRKPDEKSELKRELRLRKVMLGELPRDFLRVIPMTQNQQLSADEQAALALQQQLSSEEANPITSIMYGRLRITVIEASLNRNYGIARMDPYVRLTVGRNVYETRTDHNGARTPYWNADFNTFFYQDSNSIFIEVFDERSFTLDEKIAWAFFLVPERLLQGERIREYIPLTGKLGEGKEGVISLAFAYTPPPPKSALFQVAVMPYDDMPCRAPTNADANQIPNAVPPAQETEPVIHQPIVISEEDFEQVQEMFPNIEYDVIRTVMESNKGNKAQSINTLLTLSEDT